MGAGETGDIEEMGERHDPPSRHGPLLGNEDRPAGHGAALGVGGIPGWWAWTHRRRLRQGVEAVTPATLRGAVNVALWFGGLVAIALAGRLLVGGPRPAWFVVALAVMILVARWWDRRPKGPTAPG